MTFQELINVNLKLKTTDIKGKDYVEVNQRILAFRELYPEGCIKTSIINLDNGVVTMIAEVYDSNGKLLATGTAQEKETSSFINKTSFIENCVPLTTQILTINGWKFYHQLKRGDMVLSLNMNTRAVEYCRLTAINTYKDRPIVELSTSRFKVKCTPQHKWVIRNQYYPIDKKATEDLKVSDKIVQNVLQDVPPSIIGRKLGWLMCDCDIKYQEGLPSTAYINQSKHIDDLKELFGEPSVVTKRYEDSWMDNYEWLIPAETVRGILGEFGVASYEDLPNALSKANICDVAGCYQSMMLADGTKGRFCSTYLPLVEAIQIACARLGIATTFITSRTCKQSTRPLYEIGIKKTDGACFSEMKVRNLPPQDVWCPTTENGTWFMKQGSFVTLTSNCETSAVGRALGLLGIGIASSVASAEEVQNAILNQGNTNTTPKKKTSQKGSQKATEPYPTFEDSWTPKTQEEEIKQLCEECGKKYEDCLKWIKDKYKVENPNGLPQVMFLEVVEMLQKAKKK